MCPLNGLSVVVRAAEEVPHRDVVSFRRKANKVVVVLVTLFFIAVVVAVWLFVSGDVPHGYNGCGGVLGQYVASGLIAWCATVDSGLVVGVWDTKWLLASNHERLNVVRSVRSVVGRSGKWSYGLVSGDPSGAVYWVNPDGGKRLAMAAGAAAISPFEAEAYAAVLKMCFLSVLLAACWLCVLFWVFFDCSWRGMDNVLWWVFFVGLVPVGGLGVYLFRRPVFVCGERIPQ